MTTTSASEQLPAWSLPETRAGWNRSARWATVWLVAGLLLLAGFSVYATQVADHSAALKATGAKVTATVLEDPPESLRCLQVGVPVRFALDGVERTETLSVEGCGSGLRQDQQITVFVDRADPSNLVSDGSDNEGALAVLAACVALIGGLVLAVAAALRIVELARTRVALRAGPWVQRPARGVNVPRKGLDRILILALTDVDPPELLVVRWPSSGRALGTGPTVVTARTSNGWTAVARKPGGLVLGSRAPRSGLARRAKSMLIVGRPNDTRD
ncbi:MAG: hypothetical protein QOI76_1573 [Frankiales bacterium]|nr:hypothetical protein [Frankiales bacterium]